MHCHRSFYKKNTSRVTAAHRAVYRNVIQAKSFRPSTVSRNFRPCPTLYSSHVICDNVMDTFVAFSCLQFVVVIPLFPCKRRNLDLFQSCLILFEVLNSGTFVSTAQFIPIDLFNLNQTLFQIILNIIYMLFILILLIKKYQLQLIRH